MAYAPADKQLASHLRAYKNRVRPLEESRLLLHFMSKDYLTRHRACVVAALGQRPTAWTTVPSTSHRPGRHPLLDVFTRKTMGALDYLPLTYMINEPRSVSRYFRTDRFAAPSATAGHAVLLLEDTWVSGGHAQSAAFALKAAGAVRVVTVTMGRWVSEPNGPEWSPLLARAPSFFAGADCPQHVS